MRKVVFLLRSFESQGTQVGPLVNRPCFLVLCGEGFWRGTQAMCPLMGREDQNHLLMASEKTLCAARTRACGVTSQQAGGPDPFSEKQRPSLQVCTIGAAVWLAAPFKVTNGVFSVEIPGMSTSGCPTVSVKPHNHLKP